MVRPFNQFLKIGGRKAGHVDDGDPMKTPPVPGGLDPRDIRELNETIGCNSSAETPPFRMTSFEISKFLTTHGVDKKIVRLFIQSFGDTRKSATKLFQLRNVHERTNRRLTVELSGPTGWHGVCARNDVTPRWVRSNELLCGTAATHRCPPRQIEDLSVSDKRAMLPLIQALQVGHQIREFAN